MLTPQQISQIRTSAGLSSVPPTPATNSVIDSRKTALGLNQPAQTDTTQPEKNLGDLTGEAQKAGVDKIKSSISGAAEKYSQGAEEGGFKGLAKSTGALLEGGLGTASGALSTIFAPISGAIKDASNHLSNSPVVQKLAQSGFGDAIAKGEQGFNDWASKHPELATNLSDALNVGLAALGQKEAPELKLGDLKNTITDTSEAIKGGIKNVKDVAGNVKDIAAKEIKTGVEGAKNLAGNVKEGLSPTLTPEEATKQIIQGESTDVKHALPTIKGLKDTTNIKTYSDLSKAIDKQIIKPNLKNIDKAFSKDTTKTPLNSFTETVGKGKSAVKVNYVKDAIGQLKDFYTKTGDAKGLSEMKALEIKAKKQGLTFGEVNGLAREHGSAIKAFNANGEASSGLTKQAAENTRMGLKNSARKGLGTPDAKALDEKVSQAIKTKALIDDMAEKVSKSAQKNTKQGVIPKVIGKVVNTVDTLTGNPIKAIGKRMGNVGGNMSPLEIEAELVNNLNNVKGK